jgi:hypothetical protein
MVPTISSSCILKIIRFLCCTLYIIFATADTVCFQFPHYFQFPQFYIRLRLFLKTSCVTVS